MLVQAETDYANIIESDAQEETLCHYCFSICRYPMWKFLKEGNIISMMEIYFDYNRPVPLDIGYYFDDKYERPCLKGKYYVPSTAIQEILVRERSWHMQRDRIDGRNVY